MDAAALTPLDQRFLQVAIAEAAAGLGEGGVPVGAALVVDHDVLGRGRNRRVQWGSAIRHGETDALENAGRHPAGIYRRATMYTTLSPCHLCTGAILLYRIPRVVIGENTTFRGPEDLLREHGVQVLVADSGECRELMARFIEAHPTIWNEDIGEPSV